METLCDEITYKLVDEAENAPTTSAILGPFWRKDAPAYPMHASIVLKDLPGAESAYLFGKVVDYATSQPVSGAELDVWQAAPNGLYEQQDPEQPDMNLRGRFTTGSDGEYSFYCIRPVSYPIPSDGPGGCLLKLLDRHPYRPAHIHLIVSLTVRMTAFSRLPLTCARSLRRAISQSLRNCSTGETNTSPAIRSLPSRIRS